MRGLVVDYAGVLDGSEEDRRRWRKFLAHLREQGLVTAILSNVPGGPSADPIRQWREGGFVDAVFLSGEIQEEKPNEAAFEFVANALELEPKELVMIDDSIINVKGAVEAGMIGVYYQQFDRMIVEVSILFGIEEEF